ncbi:erythromycin esterase family protein [Aridibaculum aurantiacum]|uniref:erythromycin esterase family protein n=1 Tax=Aridibaculum aurantiacum TaxID=2810307 RepID=UPI001A97B3E9|nr:erythromycin esterase family protein [Aridibaculum aurantiacum]
MYKAIKLLSFSVLITCIAAFSCRNKTTALAIQEGLTHHPLQSEQDLDVIINNIGNARVVLLGEASHGTAEYYTWRAAITRRLINEKGFNFIAIEGEWADSYRVNNFIKGGPQDSIAAVNLLKQYNRWPTWMWANYEVASLVTWLNRHNQAKAANEKVGFFGLDVYCLWESMEELKPYLQNLPDSIKQLANQVHQCFQPFNSDAQEYAVAVARSESICRAQVEKLWSAIYQYTGSKTATTEDQFVMQQNALVALNAEKYYRMMVSSGAGSWNVRDGHMSQTLQRLLDLHGPNSKVIVWEHNTHVGDARYTDMVDEGMINVGQIARETFGRENVFIVGFGSYTGSVIAAEAWDAPYKRMHVPAAMPGSWEHMLHRIGKGDKILLSNEIRNNKSLQGRIGHRAIGVVYHPNREAGNYVPSIIPERYDAFIYFERSNALRPIPVTPKNEPPDTYPSGY